MTDLTRSNSLALRKCECCGRHPYTVGISNPHSEWQDWADYSETLYCDDCYEEVFGRSGWPRGELN
jgi:hypothetical protein